MNRQQRIEQILTQNVSNTLKAQVGNGEKAEFVPVFDLKQAVQALDALMEEERLALEWLFSGDTGVSSETLCAHMLGLKRERAGAPWDAADRGRCIRLLNKIPQWWDRLDEMNQYPSHEYVHHGANGLEVKKIGWSEQIPLIRAERLNKGEKE